MLTLENKIKELESQGLSKEEIEQQTQELFDQVLNEELEEELSYIAEINLALKIDSKLKIEKLQSILDELEIKDVTLGVDDKLKTTVLHSNLIDVYKIED